MVHLNIFPGIVSVQRMDPLDFVGSSLHTYRLQVYLTLSRSPGSQAVEKGLVNFLLFYMTFLNVIIFKVQLHNTSSNKDPKYSTCIINQCTSLMVVAVILKFLV